MSETRPDTARNVAGAHQFLPILLLFFVGSGCAALVYQVVWFQLLQLVIGLTTVSLGVLLGSFMGGLCLGSLLLPKFVSPRHHPLKVYAYLEIATAALGLLILFLIPLIGSLYPAIAGQGAVGIAVRATLAALLLLPPTILMGATLPAIARWVEMDPKGVSWLGFFYGGNIGGAVFGALLAGFYLLRVYDVAIATYVAVALDLSVGLIALGIAPLAAYKAPAGHAPQAPAAAPGKPPPVAGAAAPPKAAPLRAPAPGTAAVYVIIALSGMAALGAEVVWTRLLSLMFGGTVYTFSILLAVFLVGLGIGSSAGAFLARGLAEPRRALGVCQLLLAAAVAWTAHTISHGLPYLPVDVTLSLSPWYTFQLDVMRSFWALLPPALLWGASFPLALASVARPGEDPGHQVGTVYAANTVGAILGALVFAIILIPVVGTMWSQRILIAISGLAALIAFAPYWLPSPAARPASFSARPLVLAGVVAITLLTAVSVSPAPWGVIAYGRFMPTWAAQLQPGIVSEVDIPYGDGSRDIYCIYAAEGINGSVAVTERTDGTRSFHSAGKVQASNDPLDMRLQRLLGHIAALAHPDPKDVLVVACGAGVTAGAFVPHPGVEEIVIVDIESLVPRHVAPLFGRENHYVVDDPRTTVIFDDGRHYLRTTDRRFDIITSDPIDPWIKGSAALNTVEYYQLCKDRLNPGGVMALWIPLYESNDETIKSVVATFFEVFPDGIIWSNDYDGLGYDAVLFGQKDPGPIDVDALQERLERPDHRAVLESLSDVEFYSAVDLLSTYAGRATELREWMRGAQINYDRNLRLQYLAGLAFNTFVEVEILDDITRYYRFPSDLFLGSEENLRQLRRQIEEPRRITARVTASR